MGEAKRRLDDVWMADDQPWTGLPNGMYGLPQWNVCMDCLMEWNDFLFQ